MREIMQHVGQGLGMHQPVLDDQLPSLVGQMALLERLIDSLTDAIAVALHFGH